MGFNIAQIINKFLPVKMTDSDLRENPFQSKVGQEVVSVEENYEARLWRQGRVQVGGASDKALTAGTNQVSGTMYPSPGCDIIPIYLSASCDVDAVITFQYDTKVRQNGLSDGVYYETYFLKAGTVLQKEPKGAYRILEGGSMSILVNPLTAGKTWTNIQGIEVTTNA